jgi:ABC-type glycerol-3-phosphate transport system substrate-binding protein
MIAAHPLAFVRCLHGQNIDAYKSGQVAMQMNFAFIWPGVEADPNVGGGKSGYFPNPAGPAGQFAQLGGQGISVVANSDNKDAALEYIKWFAQRTSSRNGGMWAAIRRCVPLWKIRASPAASPSRRPSSTHGHREGFLG